MIKKIFISVMIVMIGLSFSSSTKALENPNISSTNVVEISVDDIGKDVIVIDDENKLIRNYEEEQKLVQPRSYNGGNTFIYTLVRTIPFKNSDVFKMEVVAQLEMYKFNNFGQINRVMGLATKSASGLSAVKWVEHNVFSDHKGKPTNSVTINGSGHYEAKGSVLVGSSVGIKGIFEIGGSISVEETYTSNVHSFETTYRIA